MGWKTKRNALLVFMVLVMCTAWTTALAEENQAYLELQSYGEASYRDTNFDAANQNRYLGWWENRLVWRYKHTLNDKPLWRHLAFEPYLKALLALSEKPDIWWENTFVVGVGLENRFLDGLKVLDNPQWKWAKNIRLYIEFLAVNYVKESAPDNVKDYDLRIGLGFWKEWNIPPDREVDSKLWGEAWIDLSWRRENFSDISNDTHYLGLVARVGFKLNDYKDEKFTKKTKVYYLPYAVLDTGYTGNDFFWENRINIGAGFRVMPVIGLSEKDNRKNIVFRIFAEYLHTVDHWQGDPSPGTPDHDFRIGVNFSYNLY